jgi:hypothetical protein
MVGAAAGATLAPKGTDGKESDVFGKSIDEIGAFYGMLQLKLRSHAPVRAAYSAATVWFTLVIAEILSYAASAVRDQFGGAKGVVGGPITILDKLNERAGLSRSLKQLYTRALNRTQAEQNQCNATIKMPGEEKAKTNAAKCEDRVITRGKINLGLAGSAGKAKTDEVLPTWHCSLQDSGKEILVDANDSNASVVFTESAMSQGKSVRTETAGSGVDKQTIMYEQVCAPPSNWWEELQDDYAVVLTNERTLSKSVKDQFVETFWDGTQEYGGGLMSVSKALVKLFGNSLLAGGFVLCVSILYGVMSYYTVVWNMAKIKGRCEDDEGGECENDLLTLQMAVDDKGGNSGGMQSLWDPVAQGTMGWLVADVLLSSLFL